MSDCNLEEEFGENVEKLPDEKSTVWRQPLEIDWNEMDRLLEAGCIGVEIAAYFGIHPRTLAARVKKEFGVTFSTYAMKKRARGDSLLRAKQFQTAMKGDKTLMIFLGKQRLNQADKTINQHVISSEDEIVQQ